MDSDMWSRLLVDPYLLRVTNDQSGWEPTADPNPSPDNTSRGGDSSPGGT